MRHLVTIQKIEEIQPIENADKIEKVHVKDWWVIVQKGTFKLDDLCVFFEIDSFLPIIPVFDFLLKGSKTKKMLVDSKEIEGIRLKTVKLRGQISQGLVMPILEFPELSETEYWLEDTDVSEKLNVIKYEPPIPAHLSGVMKGIFPGFILKTDEERIQNCSDILEKHKGEMFYITEKLDGSSVTYYKRNNEFGVCGRNWELKESDENTLWQIAKKLNLEQILPESYAIQGEIVGEGIQGNPYKIKGQEFYAFNVFDIKNMKYLDYEDFVKFCGDIKIHRVPTLWILELNETIESLLKSANGKSLLNPNVKREGLVVRPIVEGRDVLNGSISRLSFKVVSNEYLLEEN